MQLTHVSGVGFDMVYKKADSHETTKHMYLVDIGIFLNMGNDMLRSYSGCIEEIKKMDRMYETSHERIFRKLKFVTSSYTSEFDRFANLSGSGNIPNSIDKRLNKVIRDFNSNPALNEALAGAKALSLLSNPPQNMGYSQIDKIFEVINASYKEFSDRILEIYNESMKVQVRIYRRRK